MKRLPFTVRAEENKLVLEAVVEKKDVVVALVPVAVAKVKFWRVEEALAIILLNVPVPETMNVPPVPVVKKRFVDDAVVAKKDVVVALVPVAFRKVKFCKVVEPVTRKVELIVEDAVEKKPLSSPRVVEVETP